MEKVIKKAKERKNKDSQSSPWLVMPYLHDIFRRDLLGFFPRFVSILHWLYAVTAFRKQSIHRQGIMRKVDNVQTQSVYEYFETQKFKNATCYSAGSTLFEDADRNGEKMHPCLIPWIGI